jgi:putative Mn2+ efflux pump MntP
MDASYHAQALLMALASSTDNFLVGVSVGLTRKPLSIKVLWGIALCNAVGGFLAASGGRLGVKYLMDESTANGFAGFAFAYLAWKEYVESLEEASSKGAPKQVSLALALPMTLNNIAGGVTAGVLGVPPLWNFTYALAVSVLTMWIGYRLGKGFSGVGFSGVHGQRSLVYGTIFIYLVLCLQSFAGMWP